MGFIAGRKTARAKAKAKGIEVNELLKRDIAIIETAR